MSDNLTNPLENGRRIAPLERIIIPYSRWRLASKTLIFSLIAFFGLLKLWRGAEEVAFFWNVTIFFGAGVIALRKLITLVFATPVAILDSYGWRDPEFGRVVPWRLMRRCERSRQRQVLSFELADSADEDPAWPYSFRAPDRLRLDLRDAADPERDAERALASSSFWIAIASRIGNSEVAKYDKSAALHEEVRSNFITSAFLLVLMWGVLLLRPFPDTHHAFVDLRAVHAKPLQGLPTWPAPYRFGDH